MLGEVLTSFASPSAHAHGHACLNPKPLNFAFRIDRNGGSCTPYWLLVMVPLQKSLKGGGFSGFRDGFGDLGFLPFVNAW